MSPALLLMVLLAAGQQRGSTGAAACWVSCQRHVTDRALRAQAYARCMTGGRVDSWLSVIGSQGEDRRVLASARTDPDWRVRWGAVKAEARSRGVTERRVLADWVVDTSPGADLDACLTAARAAAEQGQSTADFLKEAGSRGPAAAARVWARRDAIREALELELYATDESVRPAALAHLGVFLSRSPARVVLEAMAGRPAAGDATVAASLKAVATRRQTSVGQLLLSEARPADEARVNRLFAVYSQELDALRPQLTSADASVRRGALASLRIYGPLARKELEAALGDDDRRARELAARALSDGSGGRVYLARQLQGATTGESARPWLEVLARDKGCAALLHGVASDKARPPAVRGEAVALLGDCPESARDSRKLGSYLSDPSSEVRAGAVRALASMPRSAEGAQAATHALEDPAPEVVAAALDAVADPRQSTHGDDAAELLGSEHPVVRAAAARALERIGRPPHVKALAECLREDPVVAVRVAAAQALANIGGPLAVAALSAAVSHDADTHVQHVSREGLRRLGFTR
ncbi:HEAT repeat domain-containing protein [Citreicoccus inhibens]|uniref:HEAT repeat domain-containing protein n=1 Tax=Citreicoccus inhibens TaxID=2849499 RepID=UPI002E2A926A|nr:HEAT repeat domain-containing protein [Citreicoccus inhibens]